MNLCGSASSNCSYTSVSKFWRLTGTPAFAHSKPRFRLANASSLLFSMVSYELEPGSTDMLYLSSAFLKASLFTSQNSSVQSFSNTIFPSILSSVAINNIYQSFATPASQRFLTSSITTLLS